MAAIGLRTECRGGSYWNTIGFHFVTAQCTYMFHAISSLLSSNLYLLNHQTQQGYDMLGCIYVIIHHMDNNIALYIEFRSDIYILHV